MRFVTVWCVYELQPGCPEEGVEAGEPTLLYVTYKSALDAQNWIDSNVENWRHVVIEMHDALQDGLQLCLIDLVELGPTHLGRLLAERAELRKAPRRRKKSRKRASGKVDK